MMALLVTHVSASGALVGAAANTNDVFIKEWGRKAADRLGRLYSPAPAGAEFWGLEAQHYIRNTGIADTAAMVRASPLTATRTGPSTYPVPKGK
jgi:hypothetical protein